MKGSAVFSLLAPAAACLLLAPGTAALGASPAPGEGVYVFDVPLGPLALSGTFPLAVETTAGTQQGVAVLSTAANGRVAGTLTVVGTQFDVTGQVHYTALGGGRLTLVAKHLKDRLVLVGTLGTGAITGKVTGKGSVLAGKNTFLLDVSAATPQSARVEAHLTGGKPHAYAGFGTATVNGLDVQLKIGGRFGNKITLRFGGKGFRFLGKGTAATGLLIDWSAKGFGAASKGEDLVIDPLSAPAGLAYVAPTVEFEEGVLAAPDTVSSTIPAYTEFTVSPALPVGLTLDKDTGTIAGTAAAPTVQLAYTVTAANPAGSTTSDLLISVRINRSKSFAAEARTLDDTDYRHLLVRTHSGVRQKDLDHVNQVGLSQFLDEMLTFPTNTPAEATAFTELVNATDPVGLEGGFPSATQVTRWYDRLMMETDAPFQETLGFFWHDHFGVNLANIDGSSGYYVVDHINKLRREGNGNLRTLLLDVARDPAMLVFLSGTQNRVGRPNENFAREFWELFSLGIDHGYTQADIVEVAKAWTGYRERLDATTNRNVIEFDATRHDPGSKTFLGTTIAGQNAADDYQIVVDTTVDTREVAEFITKKLFEYFTYRNPPQSLVDDMAAYLRAQNYELTPFLKRLFQSEAFFSTVARRSLYKSPVEFAMGFMRSTGLFITSTSLNSSLTLLDQVPSMPPTVNGWPIGDAWIYGSAMVDRINLVDVVVEDTARQASVGINIANVLPPVAQRTAPNVVDALTSLLRIELSSTERQQMIDYLNSQRQNDGTVVASPFDGSVQQQLDERVRGLLYILAQHPTYHER